MTVSSTGRLDFEGAPADAPWFDGHFPGAPITPGAVLLGRAAQALRARGTPLKTVKRMKFVRPLPPETPFSVDIEERDGGAILRWTAGETLIAHARVVLG